jgi:hypothetical protein
MRALAAAISPRQTRLRRAFSEIRVSAYYTPNPSPLVWGENPIALLVLDSTTRPGRDDSKVLLFVFFRHFVSGHADYFSVCHKGVNPINFIVPYGYESRVGIR